MGLILKRLGGIGEYCGHYLKGNRPWFGENKLPDNGKALENVFLIRALFVNLIPVKESSVKLPTRQHASKRSREEAADASQDLAEGFSIRRTYVRKQRCFGSGWFFF